MERVTWPESRSRRIMTCEVLRLHGLPTGKVLTTRQPSAAELLSVCSRFSGLNLPLHRRSCCVSTLYSMDSQPPRIAVTHPRYEWTGGRKPETVPRWRHTHWRS